MMALRIRRLIGNASGIKCAIISSGIVYNFVGLYTPWTGELGSPLLSGLTRQLPSRSTIPVSTAAP